MWDQPFTGYAFRQFEGKPPNAGSHPIYSHSSIWVSTVPGKLELQKASPTAQKFGAAARAQGGGKRRAGIIIGAILMSALCQKQTSAVLYVGKAAY